jgi:RND family efflux transporter MFP subunit
MMGGKQLKTTSALLSSFTAGLLLIACGQGNQYQEPPAPAVTVAEPLLREITDFLEFTGTLAASEQAEVVARVSGVLQSMHFEPGSPVNAGELLFTIEPEEYQADLQAANAELAAAESQYDRATIEYNRAQQLFRQQAGAEAEVVKWRVEREIASADILRARARIQRAELNLGHTQVTAPLSGRIGRNRVDMGNLVGDGQASVLTEVTRFDPIYVYFNLNERDLLRVMQGYRENAREQSLAPEQYADASIEMPLYLGLANEDGYPHEGHYDYADSSVDPETGTLQLRGVFANTHRPPLLMPGLFARLRMPLGTRPNMALISERAIGTDQQGTYVMIVNAENTVERRDVKTGQRIDGLIVIEDGLQADDRVVVKGVQRARPGRKVAPGQVEMASLSTSAMLQAAEAANKAERKQRRDAEPATPMSGE